jgi:hypothetical protein
MAIGIGSEINIAVWLSSRGNEKPSMIIPLKAKAISILRLGKSLANMRKK